MKDGMLINTKGEVYHKKLVELNNAELMDLANLNHLPFCLELKNELARRNLLVRATELVESSYHVPNH